MNRRQKKKAFKKRFGFNPPCGISTRTATRIMEYKKTIIAAFERLKAAILDLREWVKQSALELTERRSRQYIAARDFRTELLLRQQESEAKQIEGNSDIHNHDRR